MQTYHLVTQKKILSEKFSGSSQVTIQIWTKTDCVVNGIFDFQNQKVLKILIKVISLGTFNVLIKETNCLKF